MSAGVSTNIDYFMKRNKFILFAGLACLAAVLVAGLMFLRNSHQVKEETSVPLPNPPVAKASPSAVVGTNPKALQPVTPETAVSVPPRRENVVPETGGPPERVVRLKASQALASVNGVAITLKDLMPVPEEKEGADQIMSAGMYDFLFKRAVERELTFQAARAQGIELTQEQKQRLAEIRARSEEKAPEVFDTVQQNPENTAFEQRDFTGLLLQAALAEKAGVSSPHVTPELVEAYFQQHKTEYAQMAEDPAQRSPEAWQAVDAEIRAKLAPGVQAAHDEQMRKFVEQLKASASIVVAQKSP